MQREMIFRCEPKYGGLLVHVEQAERDYHTKRPAHVGEVVRCRECAKAAIADGDVLVCRLRSGAACFKVEPDDFCSRGERHER